MNEPKTPTERIQILEKALQDIIEADNRRVHRFCNCHQIAKDALAKTEV